jgi:hypothetical protein
MRSVFKFFRYYLFGFLLGYFAIDMIHLLKGDMRPLWKKGINVEWIIHTKNEDNTRVNPTTSGKTTYTGVRITYTYAEPLLLSSPKREFE